ncbi:MAG: hypothetical protein HPY50_06555 [Firmicutes bacterium]|nr:hypothetical protein [Bacillota bacterium]
MSEANRTGTVSGARIKVRIIKCGGDGRKNAYKYLARLAIANIKRT